MHQRKKPALSVILALFACITTTVSKLRAQDVPPVAQQPLLPASGAPAQTPANPAQTSAANALAPPPVAYDTEPLPHEPAAALLLASKANGLGSDELKPWYLKAHYQTYDAYGKEAAAGIFEIWWAAKDRYRVSYTSSSFTRSIFRTPAARFRLGTTDRLPYAEEQIVSQILRPLTYPKLPAPMKFKAVEQNGLRLACVFIEDSVRPSVRYTGGSYCFDSDHPVLRRYDDQDANHIYNRILVFQHRFVASGVKVFEDRQPLVTVDVEEVRGLRETELSELIPTADASKEEEPTDPSGEDSIWSPGSAKITYGRPVSAPDPEYPPSERGSGPQTVRVMVIVGKDGHVLSAEVVRAKDSVFGAAALKAMLKWKFTPYLRDGQPYEARTYVLERFVE